MKIPLYILGIVKKHGPQHGYNIKKIIGESVSDFTQIKLPAIYYHLEKLCEKKLLSKSIEKDSNRPEKNVYSITKDGHVAFQNILKKTLALDYKPEFINDAAFYFSSSLNPTEIESSLINYIEKIKSRIDQNKNHKEMTLNIIPKQAEKNSLIIFEHHEHHYQAELTWALETLKRIKPK